MSARAVLVAARFCVACFVGVPLAAPSLAAELSRLEVEARLSAAGGLIDAPRRFVPPERPLYTWWGYRFRESYQKNYGWRLDHILVTPGLGDALKDCRVFTPTRTWDQPSDHVPVILDLG